MAAREFGFILYSFSVGYSADGLVLPGSEDNRIARSLLPGDDPGGVSGRYLLRVHCKGSMVCTNKVEVLWNSQPSQPDPVLAFKPEDIKKVTEALNKVSGKDVELRFTPIA
jgi:hypothetical protein